MVDCKIDLYNKTRDVKNMLQNCYISLIDTFSIIGTHFLNKSYQLGYVYCINILFIIAFWSEWSRFGRCSKPCGTGIQTATRNCNNGKPGDTGCYPADGATLTQDCNHKLCRKYMTSF